MSEFVNVTVKVGKNLVHTIKMEKGVTFENNGGIYTVNSEGKLTVFDKNSKVWKPASKIEMTKYQWFAFSNIADNVKEGGNKGDVTYSKDDVREAIKMFKEGTFSDDISSCLPYGYKVEKGSERCTSSSVEAKIADSMGSTEAILKFGIENTTNKKTNK